MTARLPASPSELPLLRLVPLHRLEPAFDRLPLHEAWQQRCALFRHEGGFIGVSPTPPDPAKQRWLEQRAGGAVTWYRVTEDELNIWLQEQAEVSSALEELLQRAKAGAGGEADVSASADSLRKFGAGGTAPPQGAERLQMPARVPPRDDADALEQLVQTTLEAALRMGASSIHFESTGFGLVVRQRIDGVLETSCELAGRERAQQLIARLKALVGFFAAAGETRGVISLAGRRMPVRLSLLSGQHGEDAILSILEKPRLVAPGEVLDMARLGFGSAERARLHALIAQPYGLVLVAGPADSGRTTTLYAMLAESGNGLEKIVSLEKSVSHALPGVLQLTLADEHPEGMSGALRAALRHDPDRIMIDPLNDAATAGVALAAALEGRRVLAAVGGNHVFDALDRFARHVGAAPALAEALNGIVAQRLVRTVCPHCAETVVPTAAELSALALPREAAIGSFRRGFGCGACRTTGYLGRRVIAEILVFDESLRALVAERAPGAEIKAEARRRGLQSLRESAMQLARAGLTTLEEVARVTRLT